MPIAQNIFRAYDIRGVYQQDLNEEAAYLIGRGFASYLSKEKNLQNPSVVVGRDNRTHSQSLQSEFIRGLTESGCRVTNIGLSASPYLYFSTCEGEFDAGCNITASHNPKEYNGFKLLTASAHAVFGDELQKVYQLIVANDFVDGEGSEEPGDFATAYLKKLQSMFEFSGPLKVVVDTGNGIAGKMYPSVIKSFGHDVVELFTELDGTFPNHIADPIVESNLESLKQKVAEEKADIGFGFDGDGDRVGVVDQNGHFINADLTMMLLSKDALSRHPNSPIISTVSNSQVLFDLIEQWGGKPVMSKVGHSYVESEMSAQNAILGGEQSGHFFLFENYFHYDDALLTAIRVLKILSDSGKAISELYDQFPKTYAEPEIRPDCPDDVKFEIIQKVTDHFKDQYPCVTIDGIRLDFGEGGWAGIRASNTSPKLSITMEAESESALAHIKDVVLGHLKSYPAIHF